jgi:hypothetical protein
MTTHSHDDIHINLNGDVVTLIQTVKLLNEKVNKLSLENSLWAIDVSQEVKKEDGQYVVEFTFKKPNGKGLIKTFKYDEAKYWEMDQPSLINHISDQLYEMLYKQQIEDSITKSVSQGIKNLITVASKK